MSSTGEAMGRYPQDPEILESWIFPPSSIKRVSIPVLWKFFKYNTCQFPSLFLWFYLVIQAYENTWTFQHFQQFLPVPGLCTPSPPPEPSCRTRQLTCPAPRRRRAPSPSRWTSPCRRPRQSAPQVREDNIYDWINIKPGHTLFMIP